MTVAWSSNDKGSEMILSNNNLTVSTSKNSWLGIRTTKSVITGKYYWEIKVEKLSSNGITMGIGNISQTLEDFLYKSNALGIYSLDGRYCDNIPKWNDYAVAFNVGDIIGVALNCNNKKINFHINGKWYGEMDNYVSGYIYPMVTLRNNSQVVANFGKQPFKYAMPNGYKSYDGSQTVSNKFLIRQNKSYYAIKSNLYALGQPIDNIQLEQWHEKYGVDEINILAEKLSNKEIPMTLDKTNGIWKTDFHLNANNIIDNIKLIENNDKENSYKIIKHDSFQYRILDQLNDEFEIMMNTDR